jgi:type III secretion protein J
MRAALVALLLALVGCDAAIAGGLDEAQANELVVALDEQGISALKQREESASETPTFRVEVSREDASRALAALRTAELPREREGGFDTVFGAGGLVPTATEERAKLSAAIAGELVRTLETIDGVLDARVHLALPERRDVPLDATPPRPRASVLIKFRRGATQPYDDASVRALVAGAVDGLDAADVTIVGVPAPAAPTSAQTALVRFGPIAVTRSSAWALKLLLGASLLVNVVVVLGAALAMRRAARATHAPTNGGDATTVAPR